MILYIVERCVPNNRKDDSNEKEDESSHKDVTVALLFDCTELTRTIIGILLMAHSAHRHERKRHVSEHETDTDQGALTADIHQARIKGHQNTSYKESIRQDLDIHRKAMGEKALRPDHKEGDDQLNANTNRIIS